jgi:hypothetical protein
VSLRIARITVVAILVAGLGPGAIVVACGIEGDAGCCCSTERCPAPVPPTLDTVSCCGSDTPVPAPVPTTAAPSCSATDGPFAAVRVAAHIDERLRSHDRVPAGREIDLRSPPLYTLHAVFLI